MTVRDCCFILKRFPAGNNSLISKAYCQSLGQQNLVLPEYFLYKKYPLGSFEPFNTGELYLSVKNNTLIVDDIISYQNNALNISRDYKRFLFLSKVSKAVIEFAKEGDREIYKSLLESLKIDNYFGFNLLRFLLNLSIILGFSLERLRKPGWINLITLTKCENKELKKGYCLYITSRVCNFKKNHG